MQYKITKRKDFILDKEYYYLHQRTHSWNNWVEVGTRTISLESMHKQLETYIQEEQILTVS